MSPRCAFHCRSTGSQTSETQTRKAGKAGDACSPPRTPGESWGGAEEGGRVVVAEPPISNRMVRDDTSNLSSKPGGLGGGCQRISWGTHVPAWLRRACLSKSPHATKALEPREERTRPQTQYRQAKESEDGMRVPGHQFPGGGSGC